jgi:glycosidase
VRAALVALVLAACSTPPARDWRDEVIYQVVVDRFANGDPDNDCAGGVCPRAGDLARWQGGDWRGLRLQLDQLVDLGATALWISPIVAGVARTDEADGYHGYWAADLTRLEPHFGDRAELEALIDAAHDRDLRVIVDVVVNHVGRVFAYDLDGDGVVDDGELEPAFADRVLDAPLLWLAPRPRVFLGDGVLELDERHFHRRGAIADFADPAERELGDFPTGLRDLDTDAAEVRAALVDTWARWILELELDGLRLDAAPHVSPAFWRAFAGELRARIRAARPDFLLVAEVWSDDPAALTPVLVEGTLDSVLDFPFKWRGLDPFVLDGAPAATLAELIAATRAAWPAAAFAHRVVFADNHDVRRLRGELDDPLAAELAFTLVYTVGGIPSLYYGSEAELGGAQGHAARQPLWQHPQRGSTAAHLRRLAAVRRRHAALRRGELVIRHASATSAHETAPDAGLLVFERIERDRVLVAANGHPRDRAGARVATGFAAGTRLVDELGAIAPIEVERDGSIELDVPPRRAAILVPSP